MQIFVASGKQKKGQSMLRDLVWFRAPKDLRFRFKQTEIGIWCKQRLEKKLETIAAAHEKLN